MECSYRNCPEECQLSQMGKTANVILPFRQWKFIDEQGGMHRNEYVKTEGLVALQ